MSTFIPFVQFAPLVLLGAAAFALVRPGRRPGAYPAFAEAAALAALGLALASLIQLLVLGQRVTAVGAGPALLALRLDAVSATMTVLVGFVGWIVVRYARSYLDGEEQEGRFHGLMLGTLAAVLLLVQSGSLVVLAASFIAVGAGLRRLLMFYGERAEAQRAATKFALVWFGGDVLLVLAAALLWIGFGTADLGAIGAAAKGGLPLSAHIAVALLVVVAALKTASFPLHGWITEVMEAPTPVSALLHAGIINAGGFLMIRLAELVQASSGGMAALVMLGGLTALFGAVVMLTQSAAKTALAWSTVSQMGFMLLQCGLGLWPLALLHIVAHSLYKAMPSSPRAARWRRSPRSGGPARWRCPAASRWRGPSRWPSCSTSRSPASSASSAATSRPRPWRSARSWSSVSPTWSPRALPTRRRASSPAARPSPPSARRWPISAST